MLHLLESPDCFLDTQLVPNRAPGIASLRAMRSRRQEVAGQGPVGGAAGEAGGEYRRAVAAFFVAHGLSGTPLVGFGVSESEGQVLAVDLETDEAVDDIHVELQGGFHLQVQARREVGGGGSLANAVAQWVRAAEGDLEPNHDRLILVTGRLRGWARPLKTALDRGRARRAGLPSAAEKEALRKLDELLNPLTPAQRGAVKQAATIVELFVEEEGLDHARQGRLLLDGHVVPVGEGLKAWRTLIRVAGAAARARRGYVMDEWLTALREAGHRVVDAGGTPAAAHERRRQALERYRRGLIERAARLDLRPLGANLPPLLFADVDAEVQVAVTGDNERDGRELLWAFRRRGRALLTGLPGGGKTTALLRTAARWAQMPGWALPVVASMREIEAHRGDSSFRAALLDVAARDLPTDEAALARKEMESGLDRGDIVLFLDGLDETQERRGEVVAALDEFLRTTSPDVDVLLATRDVGYAQAATLGFSDLRLLQPKELERTIRAILEAGASAARLSEPKIDAWVRERLDWVQEVLARDPTLRETPLLPILLALLAVEHTWGALPDRRALVLEAVVADVVRRREARRHDEFALGVLAGQAAAEAALDVFAIEAHTILERGGSCLHTEVVEAASQQLEERWGLAPGPAEVAAQSAIAFWDESGIFVVSGADAMVAARVRLFLEIGDAKLAVRQDHEAVRRWAREAAKRSDRREALLLAAGLSTVAASELVVVATAARDRELALMAARALREGADIDEEQLRQLVDQLREDVRRGDREAWQTWNELVRLALPSDLRTAIIADLDAFPREHRAIGAALSVLEGSREEGNDDVLLAALRVEELPRLPKRVVALRGRPTWSDIAVDPGFVRAKEGAAERLLGRCDEAAPLVAASLDHGSAGMQMRLDELLRQHGYQELANEYLRKEAAQIREVLGGLTHRHQRMRDDVPQVLEMLAAAGAATLTPAQERRLDELADFCETLRLNDLSSWALSPAAREDLTHLVEVVAALGRFPRGVLAAQAEIVLELMEHVQSLEPFFSLFDGASERELDDWTAVSSHPDAVALFVRMMLRGRGPAFVAASALWEAPVASLALPQLWTILPRLRPEFRRICGYTINSLEPRPEALLKTWARSPDPVARRIAAEVLPVTTGSGRLSNRYGTLLRDADGWVRQAAAQRAGDELTGAARKRALQLVADAGAAGWLCLHCGTANAAGPSSCDECSVVGPSPAGAARTLLEGLSVEQAGIDDP
jgi:hypothetical protein